MSICKFEPRRAVEVIAPRYGSSYRIGGRLILTASHLLDEEGSLCKVRAKQSFGEEQGQVVWKSSHFDIALIELPDQIKDVQAITLGKLPDVANGEKFPFQMYGYPKWGQTLLERGNAAAGGRQIEGIIYLADTSPEGLLVLEAHRLPPEAHTSQSEWQGISGAAIICDGLVIAVQRQHQNPHRPASLEAESLSSVFGDEYWQQLLEKHGLNPEPEIANYSAAEPSREKVNAASNRVNLMKAKALEKHLKGLQEDYEVVNNQISYTLDVVAKNKLKRQIDVIEKDMDRLASELKKLGS